MGKIVFGDNLPVLHDLPDASVDLIYVDPPFNTGKRQEREQIKAVHDETNGDRTGFAGRRYQTISIGKTGYDDAFDDYMVFLAPDSRKPTGSSPTQGASSSTSTTGRSTTARCYSTRSSDGIRS